MVVSSSAIGTSFVLFRCERLYGSFRPTFAVNEGVGMRFRSRS